MRSVTIKVRVTPDQEKVWKEAAARLRQPSLSHWIRVLVDEAVDADAAGDAAADTRVEQKSRTSPSPAATELARCPRWMHHRKGVFCSSCGRTI